jgi:hypothetical protein
MLNESDSARAKYYLPHGCCMLARKAAKESRNQLYEPLNPRRREPRPQQFDRFLLQKTAPKIRGDFHFNLRGSSQSTASSLLIRQKALV